MNSLCGEMQAGIHQFHSGSSAGDAVTNSLLFTQSLLRKAGIPSDIYVENRDPSLHGHVRLLGEMALSKDDLLIVHHSMGHDVMPVIAAARCSKILHYHNITPPGYFASSSPFRAYSLLGYQQLAELRQIVEGAIADSDYNADELRKRGFSNVKTIPLLKDFKEARHADFTRSIHHVEEPCHQLLFVGRIVANKGQLDLVRFVARYADSFDHPLRLALVGGFGFGEGYLERIKAEIAESGLGDRICMTGHIPDADLRGWYRAADAYVSLSEHEGFGVPMVEAMAFDVPVVAFGSSAIRATLGGSGVIIDDKSPASLAHALRPVLEDRRARRKVILQQRKRLQDFDAGLSAADLYAFLQPFVHSALRARLTTALEGLRRATTESASREYIIEGPCETSYSLAVVNRSIAFALERKPGTTATLVPAEGVPGYQFDAVSAARYPELAGIIRPPPLSGSVVVSMRNMYPSRPAGMLGDIRLMNFFWEETAVPQPLVRLMNRYLDGIAVASRFGRVLLRNSGVRVPIGLVGCGTDHLEVSGEAPPLPRRAGGTFVFLHISSGIARKGIEDLLTAYCAVFSASDDVLLVIKTYENASSVVGPWVGRLLDGRRAAPAVQVITEALSEVDMIDLYRAADVVVLPTRGEGFNLPAAEAFALGKPVVVTNFSGHVDFCTEETAWLLDFEFEPSASHLRSLTSMWVRPNLTELGQVLRRFHADRRPGLHPRQTAAKHMAQRLTWAGVAERMNMFVDRLVNDPTSQVGLNMAWISTWNSRCGIAAYSGYLVESLPKTLFDVTVFANQVEPLGPDVGKVTRNWTDHSGTLDAVVRDVLSGGFHVAVFQFNFGLFDVVRLGRAVRDLQQEGVDCHVFLHATRDAVIDGRVVSIGRASTDLSLATRLIVHSVADVNRLKGFGLIDNVVLLPQGVAVPNNVVAQPVARRLLGLRGHAPIIASYGFLLPDKGLTELILAFGLLRNTYPNAFLLLVNSCYPSPISAEESRLCSDLIASLGLEANIVLITEYLDDADAMLLLHAADVVAYIYQKSSESSSAAVRFGLASGRPVAVTPLPIFDEVADITYRLPGTSVPDIAAGLLDLLGDEATRNEIGARRASWLDETRWSRVAERFTGMVVGLHEDMHDVRVASRAIPLKPCRLLAHVRAGRIDADLLELRPDALVRVAYQRIRGHDPDGAAEHWKVALEAGDRTPEEFVCALEQDQARAAGRPEQTASTSPTTVDLAEISGLDDAEYIREIYRRLLLREPDTKGFEDQLQFLNNAAVTRDQLVQAVLSSEEFLRANRPIMVLRDKATQAHGG